MKNQTIDGVLRELAERFAQYAESGKVAEPSMVEELRALLDAEPAPCSKSQVEPDAQGDPVAYVDYSASGGVRWRPWEHGNLSDGAPLYAEQHAPVAAAGNRTAFEIEHDAEPGDEAAFRQWRLNTARPVHANPQPGTEPSGTHPHNDGLDEMRKPVCCGSCPGGCVIQTATK